jgi:hypothetical protein
MDPISQSNPVLDALRRQLADNIERLRQAGKLARGAPPAQPSRAAHAGETLEATLRRKLAAIDRASPEGRAAATRSFVETVLVAEFGAGLLTDPGFGEMLAEVAASLQQEPELRQRLERMLAEL